MQRGHRRPGASKPKDFKGTVKALFAYLRGYRIILLVATLMAALGTAMQIFGPKVMGKATTAIFEGVAAKMRGTGGIDFARIWDMLFILIALYLVGTVLSVVQGLLLANLSTDVSYRMRKDISQKIHRLPLSYFEEHPVGETLSRITNDVDAVGRNLSQSITQSISSLTTLIGILIMMLTISPLMALLVVAIAPLSGVLMAMVFKRSQKYFTAQQGLLSDINTQVEESYGGHQVITAFGHTKKSLEMFDQTNEKLYESAWKSQFMSGLIHPLMTFVGNVGYVLVVVVGSVLASAGSLAPGDILAFIQYARNFTGPIAQFAQISTQLQTMVAAAERVFEFLNAQEETEREQLLPVGEVEGRVLFDKVGFGYDKDKPVIKGFTCDVKPGQTVAIVGHTGAGKTTMVKLLMRFYDVDEGAILVDGQDVRNYKRQDLRQAFGMVLQDTWLFSGTIMENIRYGRPDATDEEVIAAAKAAHADHFIRTLSGAYDMQLNEEADNISQGQRQLLTIARALLADNPIMILDEATSNVDTLTELRIQRAMQTLMQGRTSFVIAHRLSTIREADVILVMQDGNIVEQGTHDDLIALDGVYAELYNSQFDPVN